VWARCARRFCAPRGSINGWNHVNTRKVRTASRPPGEYRIDTRSGGSRRGSIAAFSSASSIVCSSLGESTRWWSSGSEPGTARRPAAQCSLPHGNGRLRRATGPGQISRKPSSARRIRAGSSGPSHSTTMSVLLLIFSRRQSACIATRTRSAPRKGSRRACALTTLRLAPPPGDVGRQGAHRPDVLLDEVLVGHPEAVLSLDEEQDLQERHRVEAGEREHVVV